MFSFQANLNPTQLVGLVNTYQPTYQTPTNPTINQIVNYVNSLSPEINNQIPINVILAQLQQESGFNWHAYNPEDCQSQGCQCSYGIASICQTELNQLYEEGIISTNNPNEFLNNPKDQIKAYLYIMNNNYRRYGSLSKALERYNGSGVQAQMYAQKVLGLSKNWQYAYQNLNNANFFTSYTSTLDNSTINPPTLTRQYDNQIYQNTKCQSFVDVLLNPSCIAGIIVDYAFLIGLILLSILFLFLTKNKVVNVEVKV